MFVYKETLQIGYGTSPHLLSGVGTDIYEQKKIPLSCLRTEDLTVSDVKFVGRLGMINASVTMSLIV